MEVSGKREALSEDDLICLPCALDGNTEPAHGYCLDCQEHLCDACFKHHKRSRPSRNHVLLNKEAMPKDQNVSMVKSPDETDFCQSHTDKRLEFYCRKHKSIACYVCVTLGHKTCEVDYIPDISGNISESSEFCNLMTQLRTMKLKCDNSLQQASAMKEKIELDLVKIMEEIKRFRREINDSLDKMEAEITKEVELLVHAEKRTLTDRSAAYEEIVNDLDEKETTLTKLNEDNKQNKLFIEMKRTEERLFVLKEKDNQTRENNSTHSGIDFFRNQKLIDVLKTETFGRLFLKDTDNLEAEDAEGDPKVYRYPDEPDKDKPVNVNVCGTIDVKSTSDKKECNILGILLMPPSNIIIADYNNHFIKIIDRKSNILTSEIKLSSAPYDVISLKHDKLAVALPDDKCIQVLSPTLSPDSRINVGEKCYGLEYCEDKLVVACNSKPRKVIIMTLDGKVLTAFDSQMFVSPEKVVVSKDKKKILVTDYSYFPASHKVFKMDWQGKVLKTFKDVRYNGPRGIQELDDGTFLVCYKDSKNIVRLSSDCEECEITGLIGTDIGYPTAIAYCEEEHKLYVSCAKSRIGNVNTVKVLDVKWVWHSKFTSQDEN